CMGLSPSWALVEQHLAANRHAPTMNCFAGIYGGWGGPYPRLRCLLCAPLILAVRLNMVRKGRNLQPQNPLRVAVVEFLQGGVGETQLSPLLEQTRVWNAGIIAAEHHLVG